MDESTLDQLRSAVVIDGRLEPASANTLEPELRSVTKYNFAPGIAARARTSESSPDEK